MTLTFDFKEMRESLTRIGYEIREEFVEEEYHWNGIQSEIRRYKVWNVYKNGVLLDVGFSGVYGHKRVEGIFKEELRKRVLSLF